MTVLDASCVGCALVFKTVLGPTWVTSAVTMPPLLPPPPPPLLLLLLLLLLLQGTEKRRLPGEREKHAQMRVFAR